MKKMKSVTRCFSLGILMILLWMVPAEGLQAGEVVLGRQEQGQLSQQATGITVIKSFLPLERKDYYSLNRPELSAFLSALPASLSVVTQDGSRREVPVSWAPVGDYQGRQYYYCFNPTLPEGFVCEKGLELPYVVLWLGKETRAVSKALRGQTNEEKVFYYLTGTMGLNTAAACGILANIRAESNFEPTLGSSMYGICQWYMERKTMLISYCQEHGYSYDTLEGQLHFLEYELGHYYSSVLRDIRAVENSASGAYEAGYIYCKRFEIPADTENQSQSRGRVARDTYWPKYRSYEPGESTDPGEGEEEGDEEGGETIEDPASSLRGIGVSPSKKVLYVSSILDKVTLSVTYKGVSGGVSLGTLSFSSSDPSVARVSKKGVVTAKKKGTATITAKLKVNQKTYKAKCKITVKKVTISTPSKLTLKKGTKSLIGVSVKPSGKITFSSSDKSIATVSKSGQVTGKKKGSCTITVQCLGVKKKVKVTVK